MQRVAAAIEEAIPSLLLAVSVLGVTVGVVGRYVFNHPVPLVNELAVVALVWQVFLGASAAFRHDVHVRILVLIVWLPSRWQRRLAVTSEVATILVLAGTGLLALQFVQAGVRTLPMTGWSYRTVNSAVLVGLVLGASHAFVRLVSPRRREAFVNSFGQQLGSSWDEPMLAEDR